MNNDRLQANEVYQLMHDKLGGFIIRRGSEINKLRKEEDRKAQKIELRAQVNEFLTKFDWTLEELEVVPDAERLGLTKRDKARLSIREQIQMKYTYQPGPTQEREMSLEEYNKAWGR